MLDVRDNSCLKCVIKGLFSFRFLCYNTRIMKTPVQLLLVSALLGAACAAAERPDVLCIYYPEWHVYPKGEEIFGKGRTEWDFVKTAPVRFPGHRQPLVPRDGYLNDADPADVAKEIDYAADSGIDVFVYDWYWADGQPIQHEALEQGFLKASNAARMKFALMWAYHDRTDAFRAPIGGTADERNPLDGKKYYWRLSHTPEEWRAAMDYCIQTYFRSPRYYLKDGKLFFSIYNANWFVRKHGGPVAAKRYLAEAQGWAKRAGLPPIHFSGMVRTADDLPEVVAAGFDSTSTYCLTPYNLKDGHARMKRGELVFPYAEFAAAHEPLNRSIAAASSIPHIPVAVRGWDVTPRCRVEEKFPWRVLDEYPYIGLMHGATPELFKATLEGVKRQALDDPKKPGAILINAWNEYTEGSYLLPDEADGDAYLKAVREVFGTNRKQNN